LSFKINYNNTTKLIIIIIMRMERRNIINTFLGFMH
jgi:hypothetical protein